MPESSFPGSSHAEIKAAAHLMLLEPGLYCVANTPGAAPPDPATGLPGVRISPAPGLSAGQVMLSGFGTDGWIGRGDDALLVRIVGAPAHVLVTIYQSATGLQEPPQLKVIRLSGAAAPAADPAPAETLAHVYGVGDIAGRFGEWIGERGSQRWIEGFSLQPLTEIGAEDIEYQAVLGRGWMSPWSEGGQFCGSRGMSLPILGLSVRLRGEAQRTHRLLVSASFVDGTTAGPVAEGEPCEAQSLAALEAFQVVLEPKPQAAAAPPKPRKKR